MRLIDADEAIKLFNETCCANCDNHNGVKCRACYMKDGADVYDDAPTVDAVEVVRCKDCVFRNKSHYYNYCEYPDMNNREIYNLEGFCNFGVRKEEA